MNPTRALANHLKALLAAFDSAGDADGYAVTALCLGKLVGSQDRAEGCRWLKEGMTRIQGSGKERLQAKYLLAVAALRCGDRAHCWEALAEAERLWEGHIPGLVAVERERGLICADEGEWAASASAFARARALLPQGAHALQTELEAMEAHACLCAGDGPRALKVLSEPSKNPRSPQEKLQAIARWELIALCHCATSAHRQALVCTQHALNLINQGDPLRLGPLVTCAELFVALGEPRRASGALTEARALVDDQTPTALRARWHICMASLQPQQAAAAELQLARAFALGDAALLTQIDQAIEKLKEKPEP